MILTGKKILEEVREGKIRIDPFDSSRLTTNSYDLALGKKLIRYTSEPLDPKVKPEFETLEIPPEGFVMEPGDFFLGHTEEKLGSDHYVPIIHAKSGTARMGLFVHVTSDLIDLGFYGNLTFQLYATLPVRLSAGMKLAQVTFWIPKGDKELYAGKYQHSEGPQISRAYLDHGGPDRTG
jgi:dCTP deaminase